MEDSLLDKTPKVSFRSILPFLFLETSMGLCVSLQATFYPIEAGLRGATPAEFGAVFGTEPLALFIFGEICITGIHTHRNSMIELLSVT